MYSSPSAWLSALWATPVHHRDGRSCWRLGADLIYWYAPGHHRILVPAGTVSDYASVPRWPIIWWLLGDVGHAAAVVHDHLCNDLAIPRRYADTVYLAALASSGVPRWRRALLYAGVRLGARLRGGRP
jgi:hypothetical protein